MARGKRGSKKDAVQEGANQQAPSAEQPASAPASESPVSEPAKEEPAKEEPAAPAPEQAAAPEAPKAPAPAKEQPKRALASTDPNDQIMSIEDAAGSMVDGYKESWLPAIRAKARSMGVQDKASRRTWRGVFVAWGGESILR